MATNLLEHVRSLHGEISADKHSIKTEVLKPEDKHKRKIIQSHIIKARISRIASNSKKLIDLYEDKTGILAETESKISGKNSLRVFYSEMNSILSQKKLIGEGKRGGDGLGTEPLNIKATFSGEEFYGKYVEMNSHYETFLNLRGMPSMYLNGIKKIDYKLFLEVFDHFHHVPQRAKHSTPYRKYCASILSYLVDFYRRRYPLHPVDAILSETRVEFEQKWRARSVPGWQLSWPDEIYQRLPAKCALPLKGRDSYLNYAAGVKGGDNSVNKGGDNVVESDVIDSKKINDNNVGENELIDKSDNNVGDKDVNKGGDNGINKGGDNDNKTFCSACQRRFKTTVFKSHLAGKKHLKNELKLKQNGGDIKRNNNGGDNKNNDKNIGDKKKETAFLEFAIKVFKTLLAEVFEETCYFIEKKLTRTYAEIQKELLEREREDEDGEDDLGDDEDGLWTGGVYNPKKIPLGWDGRPIPYWLYKFHGLNIGYKCDICGGTKYYGPRAFQQHFKEWKHAHGMKALGIPNTKHFHNITKIEEAETLYQKLKEKKMVELFNPQTEEEFEDQEGNVYGKQTYEALKRQRVI